jgi:hypothetical protein
MAVNDGEPKAPVTPEDQSKASDSLPNPDLNPTINPMLGKNLGRWAQVYFTTPPEKRERAVQELLRQLEEETAKGAQAEAAARSPEPSSTEGEQEAVVCPACLHRNKSDERLCELCGFPLQIKSSGPGREKSIPVAPPPEPVERKPNDWEWLRQKNQAKLDATAGKTRSWMYVAPPLVVLALGAAAYLLWWNYSPAPEAQPSVLVTVRPAQPQQSARPERKTQQAQAKELAQQGGTGSGNTKTPSEVKATLPASQGPTPAVPVSMAEGSAVPAVAPGSNQTAEGQQELMTGRRYLEGQGVPKDTALAATWLWKAVAKQNPDAVLLLSDLYIRGDGVPRSCDQARVLLSAAAKKGSRAASTKLESLNSAGCP